MPGFSCVFVDKPRRRCLCPVCRLPMRDPVQIKTCGHRFCDVCLQELLRLRLFPLAPGPSTVDLRVLRALVNCVQRAVVEMLPKVQGNPIGNFKLTSLVSATLIKVVAETRPERFGWLLRWYDEIYTCFDFVIQHHYLSQYSASFAENFYDLKRVQSGKSAPEPLSRKAKWRSILFFVFVPYLKHKLDQVFEDLKYREDTLPRNANASLRVKTARAYLALYPYFHMLWEGTALFHMLAYAFQRSRWHSLLLRLSGTELRHNSGDDDGHDAEMAWSDARSQSWLRALSSGVLHGAATALSTGLSVGVFFLQFLDWWYNSDASAPALTALPTPDPPQRGSAETSAPHTCPICGRTRTNETALSVSGYIFCFPCIYEYVKKHGCCPVTSYPAMTEHLIKIYQPDS